MNLEEEVPAMEEVAGNLALEDEWILSRLERTRQEVTANLDKFELGLALQKVYDFTWNEYCDWYIEMTKTRLYGDQLELPGKRPGGADRSVERHSASCCILSCLLSQKKSGKPCPMQKAVSWWHPGRRPGKKALKPEMETRMEHLMTAIRNIRNIRAEMNVPHSVKAALQVWHIRKKAGAVITIGTPYLKSLAGIADVSFLARKEVPDLAVSTMIPGAELYIPLAELIDIEKEIQRWKRKKKKCLSEIKRVDGKLANEGFLKKHRCKW
jgi:valyl-tRNA synthetase